MLQFGLHIIQTSSSVATSSASNPSQSSLSNGLSTSQKAGIGGGIAGGVLLLALVAVLFYMNRLKRKRPFHTNPDDEPPQYTGKLGTTSVHEVVYGHSELAEGNNHSELPTGREVHELPVQINNH